MINYQRYLRERKENQDLDEAQPFSGADKRTYTKLYQKDIAAGKAPNLQSPVPGKSLEDIKAAAKAKFDAKKAAGGSSSGGLSSEPLPMSKLSDKPSSGPSLSPSKDKQDLLNRALSSTKCKKCGEKLGPTDVYCGECGEPTGKSGGPTSSPLSSAPAKNISPDAVRGSTISEIIRSAGGRDASAVIEAVRNALMKSDLKLKDTSFLS